MNMNKLLQAAQLLCETEMSNRRIGGIVGIGYNSIRNFRRRIQEKQYTWQDIQAMSAAALERFLLTTSRRLSDKRHPDWEYIYKELQRRDVTRALLWEEYRLANPENALSASRFNELLNEYTDRLDLTMRLPHRAGQCTFVDFAGSVVPWTNPQTGEELQAQIFVGVLGASNYTFVYAVASQSIADWVEALNKMFWFFGGATQVVVSDNLKAAVIRAGREPEINRIYFELLRHYASYPLTARVYCPRDKAKAEVGVQFVQRWVIACLRNTKFFNLAGINTAIAALLPRINAKKFKRLNGTRRSLFEELDQPALKALPAEPFEFAQWTSPQKVGLDYHVYVEKHYYSVPHALVHEQVEAKTTGRTVEIFHKGRRVTMHVRSQVVSGYTTLPEHQTEEHRAYSQQNPERFTEWAKMIGVASVAAVRSQFEGSPHELLGIRACASLQKLAKEHGVERFEAACARAQAIGSLTVKSIRSILQRKVTELTDADVPHQVDLPLHHNVRGASYYTVGGR